MMIYIDLPRIIGISWNIHHHQVYIAGHFMDVNDDESSGVFKHGGRREIPELADWQLLRQSLKYMVNCPASHV